MLLTPEHLPRGGVFQCLRYDTVAQLGAVTTIAHANAIEYCTEKGIDHHRFIKPRGVFGFTLTSSRGIQSATDELLDDHFDVTTFAEDVAAISSVTDGPIRLGNAYTTNRLAGFRLHPEDCGEIVYRTAMARFAADNRGGRALPMRLEFDHVTLLRPNAARLRPRTLPPGVRGKIRGFLIEAQQEVGLKELYLGRMMVGYDIGRPLLY